MNRLPLEKRIQIIHLLVEGNSMRSTARLADCSLNTVTKLLEDVGMKCLIYLYENMKDLPCTNIQVDEIWSFCHAKNGNSDKGGDLWTFTAIDPVTKLMPWFQCGKRETAVAVEFIQELSSRMSGRFQLTTDGFRGYRSAVDGLEIDFGRIVKQYAEPQGERFGGYHGQVKEAYQGAPDPAKIQTVHVERANLTMRTNIKRFTRKTNAHSKKARNHQLAVALFFMHYNYVRIHSTIRTTPAMMAGLTDRLWEIEDLVKL